MTNVQFSSITTDEGQQFITAFAAGRLHGPIADDHPNFHTIRDAMIEHLEGYTLRFSNQELADLFDVTAAVARHFDALSDRIKVAHGQIYLDGDVIENALTKQIMRFMDEGVEDWKPLIAFFEKVLSNPNEHSREQLYNWLDKHDFTIAQDGDIVGYKGVASDGKGGYQSISTGSEQVLVDGVPHTGKIPNPLGAEIEMPRSLVQHDPAVGCHIGLHVGTFGYASTWTSVHSVLEVRVNPRDVVSVPTECNWQKVRVCRYRVVDVVERQHDVPVLGADEDNKIDLAFSSERRFQVGDVLEGGFLAGQATVERVLADSYELRFQDGSLGTFALEDPCGPMAVKVRKVDPTLLFQVGDRVVDEDGDPGTIVAASPGDYRLKYDAIYGTIGWTGTSLTHVEDSPSRAHGRGGATSQEAKGRGRNPAQDDKGQFSGGRPGSTRDSSTGRFV